MQGPKEKGSYLISQLIKYIDKCENTSCSEDSENNQVALSKQNENPQERQIVIKKKKNLHHLQFFKMEPSLGHNHIYQLFGVNSNSYR
jgi:hypothetical protein